MRLSRATNGERIYAPGYEMADLDHKIRNGRHTTFHTAWLAEQISAMSVLLLIRHPDGY